MEENLTCLIIMHSRKNIVAVAKTTIETTVETTETNNIHINKNININKNKNINSKRGGFTPPTLSRRSNSLLQRKK